ncbi:gag-pol polyprotein [Cucumis melo var. makuwa]|uniref:Gag-pol polyprotein n=1 Tax=Cucumis melo var. makuwa TaxID=1194695 RepID=A0A5D3CWW5_CUCMM|nr:gag-pol polyprotein [Cucumis melo var. makuwa]
MMAGWEYPTETSEDGKVSPKFELKWSSAEDEVTVGNCRALNALFNGVDQNILTSHYEALKMTNDETLIEFKYSFKESSAGHVMFEDGVRGKILEKGSIDQPGLPCLQDVSFGFPMLKSNVNDICNECPTGKQVKVSHQSIIKCSTSRVLELLHLDVMGPM